MGDPHRIDDLASLRAILGEPVPGIALKNQDRLDAHAIAFIERSPFVVLATADAAGNMDASPKGDGPGMALVLDEKTLVLPDRAGNKLVYGLLNILENPNVGLIFLVPGTPETVRVNGTAELTRDPELLLRLAARGKPALLGIRVHVRECFFHCAKAFLRASLWKPETWPERKRISFGKMFAERLGAADPTIADKIDEAVAEDYRDNL